MKTFAGKITVTKPQCNREYVKIKIEDNSHGSITVCEMPLRDFALMVTGNGSQDCIVSTYDNFQTQGDSREIRSVYIDKTLFNGVYSAEEKSEIVKKDFGKYKEEGWLLWDDGSRSRQDGERYKYILYKHIEDVHKEARINYVKSKMKPVYDYFEPELDKKIDDLDKKINGMVGDF